MLITKAARRYATALLELAKEREEVEATLEDVNFINNTIQDSRELVLFLRSPIIKFDDKQAVLEELFKKEIQESTWLFLRLMARKKRVSLLDQIAQAFLELYNQYAGIIKVQVSVAQALSDQQQKALLKELEQKTAKQVDLGINIDPSLKGGMAVRIDDTVIDGTIKHQLQELQDQLLSVAVE